MLGNEIGTKRGNEIERGNDASILAIEKAGFVKMRDFDRYGNGIWTLDWGKI